MSKLENYVPITYPVVAMQFEGTGECAAVLDSWLKPGYRPNYGPKQDWYELDYGGNIVDVNPGQWILNINGETYVTSDKEFKAQYRLAKEAK